MYHYSEPFDSNCDVTEKKKKNKNTKEVEYDILMTVVLFILVCAGLVTVALIAWLIGALIKVAGGIVFAAMVIFIVLAAAITYQIRKHLLK